MYGEGARGFGGLSGSSDPVREAIELLGIPGSDLEIHPNFGWDLLSQAARFADMATPKPIRAFNAYMDFFGLAERERAPWLMLPALAQLGMEVGLPMERLPMKAGESLMAKMGPLLYEGMQYAKVLPRELWEIAGRAMTAWHGSPYKWSKVDLGKVGTGQGAASFGHGFYATDLESVGAHYRDTLSRDRWTIEGEPLIPKDVFRSHHSAIDISGDIEMLAGLMVHSPGSDMVPFMRQRIQDQFDYYRPRFEGEHGIAATEFRSLESNWNKFFSEGKTPSNIDVSRGHLYKLDIPEAHQLLDWDKPLSEQPEGVRKALDIPSIEEARGIVESTEWPSPYGGKKTELASAVHNRLRGADWYYVLSKKLGSDQAASEYLQSIGIPGHRYLTGESRGKGVGDYNYVLYDPEAVRVLERDGLPIESMKSEAAVNARLDLLGKGSVPEPIPVQSSIPESPIVTRLVSPVTLEVRSGFGSDLSPESKKLVGYYNRVRGESAIMQNKKTGMSIDFTTNCPNRFNPARGPCPYCYVEHGRVVDKLFNMKGGAKAVTPEGLVLPYNNDIMHFPDDLIRELNKDGGLRMFSFGDYIQDQHYDKVGSVLRDASERDLYIKAVTKQREFIDDWGNHPNLRANISTDNVPREISVNAPSIEEAMEWRAGRSNINIRSVALNPQEAEMFASDPRMNVVTLYHGLTNFNPKGVRHNKLLNIVMEQNPSLADKVGLQSLTDYLDTWVNMKPGKSRAEKIRQNFPDKICCIGGKCARDSTKCGFATVGSSLLAGVYLPMSFDGTPVQDEDVR